MKKSGISGNTSKAFGPLFVLTIPFFAFSQNLIQNPSFDCSVLHCDPMQWADLYDEYVCYWFCPTGGTSDIFSTQIPNKGCWASMPYSGLSTGYSRIGSQMPHSGTGFAGIYTYYDTAELFYRNYREYLQTQLISPLEPGKLYCFEMYVSLGDSVGWAAGNLSAYFHEEQYLNYMFNDTLSFQPQLVITEIILDSLGWTKVSGTLKAEAPFKYITIGNFASDKNTPAVRVSRARPLDPINDKFAYYFIDDVSLTQIDLPDKAIAGNPTICSGEQTLLQAKGNWDRFTWTLLEDTTVVVSKNRYLMVLPLHPTSYLLKRWICNWVSLDTVNISVLPSPDPDLGVDRSFCRGTSEILDGGQGYASYRWQDNSSDRFLTVTTGGHYSVWVTNEYGCGKNDGIFLSIKDAPIVDLGGDTTVCSGYPLLNAGGGHHYEWSTGSTDSVMTPDRAGEYWVRVHNECGEGGDTIAVHSMDELFIPNVVTLNSDELNSTFMIEGIGQDRAGQLEIFNRWGMRVYRADDYRGDWPGKYSDLPAGIYYYAFESKGCKSRQGWVQIIRE